MTDNNSADNNKPGKTPPEKKDSAPQKAAAGTKPAGTTTTTRTTNSGNAKAKTSTADATKKGKTMDPHATATIEKAGASKDSEMKSAAKKISGSDTKTANRKQGVDELKARAHEARQRAQQKILEKAYVSDKPTDPLERLADTFDSSAKRWEMVVYPSLFAFVLLAGYGFFLIYRLTHDISTLSQSVTRMAVIVSDSMPRMTRDLKAMTGSMDDMTIDIAGMTTEIVSMSTQMDSLTPMSRNIQSMTHNIGNMNRSVYGLSRDMHGMNRTVSSGPFGMMNDVMPFTSDTNVPPTMPPQQVWPSYNPNPQAYQQFPRQPVEYANPRITPDNVPQNKEAVPEAQAPFK
jgi:hypothetical protein